MKLVVIGLGQCGCRIADEFVCLNEIASSERGFEIITAAFAVDTDIADLEGLPHLSTHYQSLIRIGGRESAGHGVGQVSDRGAEIAREDGDKVISAMRRVKEVFESHAFLLIASSGGGTGSGSVPIITKLIKERYVHKPVYALVVLPFEYEETEERTIYNTGACLKSVSSVADAVILASNQRYVSRDFALNKNTLSDINAQIVRLFYDLLCAGEEKRSKYVGAKVLDTGDITETLRGWTVIGVHKSEDVLRLLSLETISFGKEGIKTQPGIEAVDSAISQLSLHCNPKDAGRALYLLSAPHKEMNIDLIKEIGNYLRNIAPNAIIRNGNYPREKGLIEVYIVLSSLSDVEKVRHYYNKSAEFVSLYAKRQKEAEDKLKAIDEAGKQLPLLPD